METRRYRILLVEDDELDQAAFVRMVKENGLPYDLTMACSVAKATEVLRSERFDVVLADYMLNDGTGFELLGSVTDTPVIFVTGAGDEEVAMKAYRAGAYDYLVKDNEHNYLKTVPITIENAVRHQEIKAKLRLLSHAILSASDSVYITDLDGRITFVNKSFCETYGYREEEIIGKDCSVLWATNNSDKSNPRSAVSGWEVGFLHKRRDGTTFPVSISRSDVTDDNGNKVALVVICRDISERMEIEKRLRVSNAELQHQNRLQEELAAAVCEKLLRYLANLEKALGQVEKADSSTEDWRVSELFREALANIKKAKELVGEFRNILQVDGRKLAAHLDELAVGVVAEQVFRALSGLVPEQCDEDKRDRHKLDSVLNSDWATVLDMLGRLAHKSEQQDAGVSDSAGQLAAHSSKSGWHTG